MCLVIVNVPHLLDYGFGAIGNGSYVLMGFMWLGNGSHVLI